MPKHAVQRYMTVGPQVVSIRQSIAQVHQLLRDRGCAVGAREPAAPRGRKAPEPRG